MSDSSPPPIEYDEAIYEVANSGEGQPAVVIREQGGTGRSTPFWVLTSVVVGFLLPVCACMGLSFSGVLGLAGLGSLGSGGTTTTALGSGPAVAVVRVEGTIIGTDDENFISGAGSGTIIKELRWAEEDPDVKAIVLRVDSPGGTVTGSAAIHDFIRDEVTKPVVVSMFNVAASGGYYVSAPADYIIARPQTTTGSIGVIVTLFNASELLDEYGIDVISITTGPNKAIGSPWETFTVEQREIFVDLIEESYDEFIDVIAAGRDLPRAEVIELADGRVYTGRQALVLDLVDELGDFGDAIDHAAGLGGIAGEPRIIEYERVPDLEDFFSGLNIRLQTSETEALIEAVSDISAPVVEYRYLGR